MGVHTGVVTKAWYKFVRIIQPAISSIRYDAEMLTGAKIAARHGIFLTDRAF